MSSSQGTNRPAVSCRFTRGERGRPRYLPATILILVLSTAGGAAAASPPWEVWDDPRQLPRLTQGDRVLLHSSHCPWGCRYDNHSDRGGARGSRFLRVEGEEGVIFDQRGPGAVTRIWMTTGLRRSMPFEDDIRLRIYLDGKESPQVDLPLADFFAGTSPPFTPPLVGNRLTSSGGNFSYVPIPYRAGCRITLTGAEHARIWFQVTYHRLSSKRGVKTFTGGEDLGRWIELLSAPGEDPWPETKPADVAAGRITLNPGGSAELYSAGGKGLISGLRLEAPAAAWDDLQLILTFDGRATVYLPLRDFFAIGRGGELPTRSLLVGLDAEDRLYAYFPMPFFEGMTARLTNAARAGPPRQVGFWIRRSARRPDEASGLFGAQVHTADAGAPGTDAPLLAADGRGKWVGLFADLGSVGTVRRDYLEGDERIYLDRERQPAIHGTGTEDLFGGGFYFDRGPFRQALHGMAYQLETDGESVTGAYRLLLTDAVSFETAIRAGLEAGPAGETPIRLRAVSYFYRR